MASNSFKLGALRAIIGLRLWADEVKLVVFFLLLVAEAKVASKVFEVYRSVLIQLNLVFRWRRFCFRASSTSLLLYLRILLLRHGIGVRWCHLSHRAIVLRLSSVGVLWSIWILWCVWAGPVEAHAHYCLLCQVLLLFLPYLCSFLWIIILHGWQTHQLFLSIIWIRGHAVVGSQTQGSTTVGITCIWIGLLRLWIWRSRSDLIWLLLSSYSRGFRGWLRSCCSLRCLSLWNSSWLGLRDWMLLFRCYWFCWCY